MQRVYPFLRIARVVQKEVCCFLFSKQPAKRCDASRVEEKSERRPAASFERKFSLRRRTATMCPPSENIQKRHTDNLSARRPRLRANETSRRYTVNTGSDDDVEAAVQEAVTSHDRSFALFLVVYAPSVRSSIFVVVPREYTYTVKSMIIHICAVVATVCVSRNT